MLVLVQDINSKIYTVYCLTLGIATKDARTVQGNGVLTFPFLNLICLIKNILIYGRIIFKVYTNHIE